jgi:DNA ligase-1
MLFKQLVSYSDKISKTPSRNDKIEILVGVLKKIKKGEAEIGVNFLSGKIRQGKLNLAWKGLSDLLNTPYTKSKKAPSLIEVDKYLEKTKSAKGGEKLKVLYPLFHILSVQERKYLVSLILRDVKQGAGEGIIKMAIAKLFKVNDNDIEYAYMRKPDIGKLFVYLLEKGRESVKDLGIKLFSPVKPMLAQIANSLEDVFEDYNDFALEYKLDGIRIQIHKQNDKVKIFSRHLKDVTPQFPELIEISIKIPVEEFILDGEAIGIDKKGRPLPFQILAQRTTRKKNIEVMKGKVPVIPKFFDILYSEGRDLTFNDCKQRWKTLNKIIKNKDYLTDRKLPKNKGDAEKFLEKSLKYGNEGIMVKLLDSSYRPGKRGNLWFKIKKAHTIDCVILAAEWGHGRRKGWLSNLHLGILDETKTKFLMVGKTFKGLTDKMLIWFTNNLPKYKVYEDSWTVYVKPKIVVEIAFNEVQISPKYESGYALRFARVKRIRDDKKPEDINTILDLERLILEI